MDLRLDDATRDDVSRALETMLAAGMALGKDVTQDPKVLADAYWWSLRGVSKVALQTALEETLQFGPKWVPAANELRRRCWELDNPKGAAAATSTAHTTVDQATRFDELGPIARLNPVGQYPHLPRVQDTRCPLDNCACDPVEVWMPATAFGGPTKGWGMRWVWSHVALEQKLKRAVDWHPIKGNLR